VTDPGGTNPEIEQGLSPRPARPARSRRVPRLVPWLVTAGVGVAVVLLVANLLGDAALFFYNADEAVARRSELGDDRFRVQGTPVDNTVIETFRGDEPVVAFSITFDGVPVDVVHVGDPPELFQPGVPVVLEGSWVQGPPPLADFSAVADDGWHFASDRMLVRHDNDYRDRDDYEERIDEAEVGGTGEASG
jgi:cytochrome c-type biogenesis protein CcmE